MTRFAGHLCVTLLVAGTIHLPGLLQSCRLDSHAHGGALAPTLSLVHSQPCMRVALVRGLGAHDVLRFMSQRGWAHRATLICCRMRCV